MTCTTALYFAYGSNLNEGDWARTCEAYGIDPAELEPLFPAYLPDMTLRFNFRSGSRNGGVLGIEDALGCLVSGFVYRASAKAWAVLDEKEGHPNAYQRICKIVLTEAGEEVPVETYLVNPRRSCHFVKPSDDYLEICHAGRVKLGLETGSLVAAATDQPPAPLDAMFAYGTLMRGESRFNAVSQYGLHCALLAETRGALALGPGYPALLPDGCDDVQGDFFRSKDIRGLLNGLDTIEGFSGFGQPGNLFRRTLCNVHVGDGRVRLAWVYLSCDNSLPRSPSPDWRYENGRFDAFRDAMLKAHADAADKFFECLTLHEGHFSGKPDEELTKFDPVSARRALDQGQLSEREFAQVSGCWTAMCS